MPKTTDPTRQLVSRVRTGATRLSRAAGEVTDSKSFVKFVERLVKWNDSRARMVSEIIGQPDWSDAFESSMRKAAKDAMEGAGTRRKLDRQWEIERLEARERAARVGEIDDTTRQYHAELRATFSLTHSV